MSQTIEIKVPDIGGFKNVAVIEISVKPGDQVDEDAPLVEVMTDKATVTLPSPRRGRVTRLHYQEGEVARVHAPLLEMEIEDAGGAASPAEGKPTRVARAHRPLATPAVRAVARQLGVDLDAVRGTGPGGRVTREDLARAGGAGGAAPGPAPARQREASLADDLPLPPAIEEPAHGDEIVPLRGIRRRIAERMAQSKRTAAHFTFVEQVDVTELLKVKARVAAAARERGVRVTLLPFVVKAAVAALKRHPWLNATLDEARGEVRLRRDYHIGIASATEQGLVVPVVRGADRLSLLDLAREIERLSADSKAGRARPSDMGGSTFTISSLGAQGGLFATPIINLPEVAILGIHRIRPTPVVHEGRIVARDVMNVSLSFDHRVVDGHVGAAFAYTLVAFLEDPTLLFMEMV